MPCEHLPGLQNITLQPVSAELPEPELLHSPWIHPAWFQINSKFTGTPQSCSMWRKSIVMLILLLLADNINKCWFLYSKTFHFLWSIDDSLSLSSHLAVIIPSSRTLIYLRSHPTEDVLYFSPSLLLPIGCMCGQKYACCTKHECKKDFSTKDLHTIPVFYHRNDGHHSSIHPLHFMFSC